MITGTLVNALAVAVGGLLGLALRSRLPVRVSTAFFQAIGLFTLFLGVSMSLKTQHPLLLVGSLILGALTGSLLRLQERMERLGDWLQRALRLQGGGFSEGMVMAFLMFCMGSMTILGAIEEGLGGAPNLLLIKSLMDGFTAIALAVTLGAGVLFAIIPLLIYQGGITLLAAWLSAGVSGAMIDELSATGGVLLIGMGIHILAIKKVEAMNLLPSLLYMIILFHLFG